MAVPNEPPETSPAPVPTLAVTGALLLHVPPAVRSLRVDVRPRQTLLLPVMATGTGSTAIAAVTAQPVG